MGAMSRVGARTSRRVGRPTWRLRLVVLSVLLAAGAALSFILAAEMPMIGERLAARKAEASAVGDPLP